MSGDVLRLAMLAASTRQSKERKRVNRLKDKKRQRKKREGNVGVTFSEGEGDKQSEPLPGLSGRLDKLGLSEASWKPRFVTLTANKLSWTNDMQQPLGGLELKEVLSCRMGRKGGRVCLIVECEMRNYYFSRCKQAPFPDKAVVSSEFVKSVLMHSNSMELPPNAHVYEEGDHADAMYTVAEGSILVVHKNTTGKFRTPVLGVDSFFGLAELFSDNDRVYTAIAGPQGARVCRMRDEMFDRLIQRFPDAGAPMRSLASDRLRYLVDPTSFDADDATISTWASAINKHKQNDHLSEVERLRSDVVALENALKEADAEIRKSDQHIGKEQTENVALKMTLLDIAAIIFDGHVHDDGGIVDAITARLSREDLAILEGDARAPMSPSE